MTTKFRLIHRVEPYRHEDVFGFLMRVVERNHFKGGLSNLMVHALGKASSKLLASDVSKLAYYCRNTPNELAQLSGIEASDALSGRIWQVEGKWVSKASFVSFRYPKICPNCIHEAPYIRGMWSLSFYTACAVHGVRLIGSCPNCRRHLQWDRRSVRWCNCGFDLATVPAMVPDTWLTAMSEVIACCVGLAHAHNAIGEFDQRVIERLATLSLDGLCKTIWFLGHCIAQRGEFGTAHGHLKPRSEAASKMIRNAFNLLESWPRRLGEKLHEIATNTPAKWRESSLRRLLGPIQDFLEEDVNTDELAYIRHAYEQHIKIIWKSVGRKIRSANFSNQLEMDLE